MARVTKCHAVFSSDERFDVATAVTLFDVLSEGAHLSVVLDYRLLLVLVEHSDERGQYWLVAYAHQVREGFAERGGGLFQVVVRYPAEHVVHLVRADRMNDVVYDAVMAVDGRQLAAYEVPSVIGEPRHAHLRMVQEGDDDDVGAEDEERHKIVDGQRGQAVRGVEVIQPCAHDGHGRQRAQTAYQVTNEHLVERVEMSDASGTIAAKTYTRSIFIIKHRG
jgi:hypothetical protein